jgi:hypothetical protein
MNIKAAQKIKYGRSAWVITVLALLVFYSSLFYSILFYSILYPAVTSEYKTEQAPNLVRMVLKREKKTLAPARNQTMISLLSQSTG